MNAGERSVSAAGGGADRGDGAVVPQVVIGEAAVDNAGNGRFPHLQIVGRSGFGIVVVEVVVIALVDIIAMTADQRVVRHREAHRTVVQINAAVIVGHVGDVIVLNERVVVAAQRIDAAAVEELEHDVFDAVIGDGIIAEQGHAVLEVDRPGDLGAAEAPAPAEADCRIRQIGQRIVRHVGAGRIADPDADAAPVDRGGVVDRVVGDGIVFRQMTLGQFDGRAGRALREQIVIGEGETAERNGVAADIAEDIAGDRGVFGRGAERQRVAAEIGEDAVRKDQSVGIFAHDRADRIEPVGVIPAGRRIDAGRFISAGLDLKITFRLIGLIPRRMRERQSLESDIGHESVHLAVKSHQSFQTSQSRDHAVEIDAAHGNGVDLVRRGIEIPLARLVQELISVHDRLDHARVSVTAAAGSGIVPARPARIDHRHTQTGAVIRDTQRVEIRAGPVVEDTDVQILRARQTAQAHIRRREPGGADLHAVGLDLHLCDPVMRAVDEEISARNAGRHVRDPNILCRVVKRPVINGRASADDG